MARYSLREIAITVFCIKTEGSECLCATSGADDV